MEIEIWDRGLQEQEIRAINRIKAAFTDQTATQNKRQKGGSLREQLGGYSQNSMFPWKGYAGFRLVDSRGKEGEFDLVIVTHCNVLIVELKDWNHQDITARGDMWYKGGTSMGRSPVSVTDKKKNTLLQKLEKLKHRFTNKGFKPFVEFFVVMTGNANFDQLPDNQLKHTLSIDAFLKFANRKIFQDYFRPHPNAQVLNQDFAIFDELFQANDKTNSKPLRADGYAAQEKIFEHPQKVYSEYLAKSEMTKGSEALLRVWNFNNIEGDKAYTLEGRAEIVSREREVLQHINRV